MNILYTHRTRGIGAEGVHIRGMMEAFSILGHRVAMDCLSGCNPLEPAHDEVNSQRRSCRRWLKATYDVISENVPQAFFETLGLFYNLWLFCRLGFKLISNRPDLVYERYSLGTFSPTLLCKLLQLPLVLEMNESVLVERSRELRLVALHKSIEHWILSNATLIVTISNKFRAGLVEEFPGIADKILVCPNAISKEPSIANPCDEGRPSPLQVIVRGSIRLGSVGQFVPWHGLEPFVAAMAELARDRDLGFIFIGDGPVRQAVVDVARAHDIQDRVMFTGMVPHSAVHGYLALIDIAVIPFSNTHGSPMKLAEFMVAGLPIVAPSLPPICEVIKDGATGCIFRSGDLNDMRRRLVEVLDDMPRARKMGQRAREYALNHLTWEHNANAVLDRVERFGRIKEG